MRGLKLNHPHLAVHMTKSHLLQMRGLKQQDQKYDDAQRMSHLLQMRGLKLLIGLGSLLVLVASFTDAWIETYQGR